MCSSFFSLDIICSSKFTASFSENVRLSQLKISTDIYACLFSRQTKAIIYSCGLAIEENMEEVSFLPFGQMIPNHRLTKGHECFYKAVMIW